MHIANPIYDVVFKYLMEDNKIARIFLSAIIGEEIESIDFLPQESIAALERRSFTVYRLDFSAKIKTETGYKNVIIEIQKAKFATDIMRFRKYLGEQYLQKNNSYLVKVNGKEIRKAMPLISIYFLGHKLNLIEAPIIKVARHYYDLSTGEEIHKKEDFIESLTHNSFVIQIPLLKKKRRTELEQLLDIFDQANITSDQHILNVKEEDFPEKYRGIIRRLQKATAEPEMRKKMDLEDEVLEELEGLERELELREEKLKIQAKAIEDKEKVIEDKEKSIQDKDKAIEEKDKLIQELLKKLEEKK